MSWHSSIGQRLVDQKVLTPEQLETARAEAAKTGAGAPEMLLRRGMTTEKALAMAQAEACGVPFVDLMTYAPDPEMRNLIPERVSRQYEVLPLFRIDNTVTVAMQDPSDILALDAARGRSGLLIDPVVSAPTAIRHAIERIYAPLPPAPGAGTEPGPPPPEGGTVPAAGAAAGAGPAADAVPGPAPQPAAPPADASGIVADIVEQAAKEGASDIHVEPTEHELDIRFRVDGVMKSARVLPKSAHPGVVSRIKILANLDIAESRLPQDGRFRQTVQDRPLDLRVSVVPTVHGENVVMRLLDNKMTNLGLPQLGMGPAVQALFERLVRSPYGLLLVTGPTGSGKTTTLYTTLALLNTPDRHIITIEDPVEYRMAGIRQIQVNERIGLRFATGLRSILRQDPDVIMIGEIRDKETVEIAIQSALTGHFVLSTLHTNDAASALARMVDMGIDPFLICSSVVGVVSQRLVRAVCPDCKEAYTLDPASAVSLGLPEGGPLEFVRGKGCLLCKSSGFRGRKALYEVLPMTPAMRALVAKGRPADELRAEAEKEGMTTLAKDGMEKARRGITTVEEVVRVTRFS